MTESTTESPSTSTETAGSSPSRHFLYQLRILAALQLKKPGEVYTGTAKGRHRKTESPAVRRRRRHKAVVAKRSKTVRINWHCGRGVCAAKRGHEGTCAEASGWSE